MKILTQKFYDEDGTLVMTTNHLYSEDGYFERAELNQGWHIELGTDDAAANYDEIPGHAAHDVPDALPDVIIHYDEPEEEATIEDYKQALRDLGVEIPEDPEEEEVDANEEE